MWPPGRPSRPPHFLSPFSSFAGTGSSPNRLHSLRLSFLHPFTSIRPVCGPALPHQHVGEAQRPLDTDKAGAHPTRSPPLSAVRYRALDLEIFFRFSSFECSPTLGKVCRSSNHMIETKRRISPRGHSVSPGRPPNVASGPPVSTSTFPVAIFLIRRHRIESQPTLFSPSLHLTTFTIDSTGLRPCHAAPTRRGLAQRSFDNDQAGALPTRSPPL